MVLRSRQVVVRSLLRLGDLPGATEEAKAGYHTAVGDAAAKGVVGIVDMEFGAGYLDWPDRFTRRIDQLRVRLATHPDQLENVIAAGIGTGEKLAGGDGLLTMGRLKIISDGSGAAEHRADRQLLVGKRRRTTWKISQIGTAVVRPASTMMPFPGTERQP